MRSWPQPRNDEDIELWVERIPYPETRYYTKKVLDNLFGYSGGAWPGCDDRVEGMGQTVAKSNSGNENESQQQQREPGGSHHPKTDQIKPRQQQR